MLYIYAMQYFGPNIGIYDRELDPNLNFCLVPIAIENMKS